MTQAETAYDDELAPVLGPPGDSDGGDGGRTRRYPDLKVKGKTGVVISSPADADAELELEQRGSVRSLARSPVALLPTRSAWPCRRLPRWRPGRPRRGG